MKPAAPRGSGRTAVAITVLLALSALFVWLDRQSVERGNRMFRGGDVDAAVALYAPIVANAPDARAEYNLGTAYLALGSEAAAEYLRLGAADSDTTVARASSYNLAYDRITRVVADLDPDSAIVLLEEAIAGNRAALRLGPGDEDARWNLALAQRMLDSIATPRQEPRGREQAGQDETLIDLVAMTRSGDGVGESGREPENPPMAEAGGERRGSADGAREAWTTQDPGPMSPDGATRLVTALSDDPEALIRGILWSKRPDVAWWRSEAYPGGDW